MMKHLYLRILFIYSITVVNIFSQWKYELVNNGFDEPYKIAYSNFNNKGILKMEVETVIKQERKLKFNEFEDIKNKVVLYDTSIICIELNRPILGYETNPPKMDTWKILNEFTKFFITDAFIFDGTEYFEVYTNKFIFIKKENLDRILKDMKYNLSNIIFKTLLEDFSKEQKDNFKENIINSKDKNIIPNNIIYQDSYSKKTIREEIEPYSETKKINFYLTGPYFCDDIVSVDIVFIVNNKFEKYNVKAEKSENSKTLFLIDDVLTHSILEYIKSASSVKIRVNESHCENIYYVFNMAGSTKAIDFLLK